MKYSSMHICCVEENLYTSIWQTGRATCELPGGLCMMGVRWVSHPIGLSLLAVCWAPSHLRVFEGVVMSELSQLHSAWGHTDCSSYWRTLGRLEWMDRTVSLFHSCILPSSLSHPLPSPLPVFSAVFWLEACIFIFPEEMTKVSQWVSKKCWNAVWGLASLQWLLLDSTVSIA